MATLVSNGTQNFTGTWDVVDSTSLLDSDAAKSTLTTSYVASSTFTPGAIVIKGLLVKVARRVNASPTGTMTVSLENATGTSGTANAAVTTTTGPPGTLTDTRVSWTVNDWVGATVTCNGKTMVVASNTATTLTGTAGWSGGGNPGNGNSWSLVNNVVLGTEVTINVSDVQAETVVGALGVTNAGNCGWYYFAFGSNVTLLAATNYAVQAKTSSSSQIDLNSSATTNWDRMLVTTTTQSGVNAGDAFHIAKAWTAAGTGTASVVTMDGTATSSYGPTVSGGPADGWSVGNGCTFQWGTASSTAYYFKWKGVGRVYAGGTFHMYDTTTRCPSSSSSVAEMDSAANVDTGLYFAHGSTVTIAGDNSRLRKTLLTADRAAGGAQITVGATTGWANSDQVAIASTTRTAGDAELKTISTVDSSTAVTLSTNVSNAHSGTSPTQAEVINLTSNVKIRGMSTSLCGFISIGHSASANLDTTVTIDNAEIYYVGSASSSKKGIDCGLGDSGSSLTVSNCAIYSGFSTSYGIYQSVNMSGMSLTYDGNVMWAMGAAGIHTSGGSYSSGTVTITNNTVINCATGFALYVPFATVTGNTATSGTGSSPGFSLLGSGMNVGTWSGNVSHSNGGVGVTMTISTVSITGGQFGSFTIWRNNSFGFTQLVSMAGFSCTDWTMFGNSTTNFNVNAGATTTGPIYIKNLTSSGDSTFSTINGINMSGATNVAPLILEDCDFGTASGIKTAHTTDVAFGANSHVEITARNCKFSSATEFSAQSNMLDASCFIRSQKHDQTVGLHKAWTKYGSFAIDTVTYRTASPSEAITPIDTVNRAFSFQPTVYYVASGGTASPSVWIYKSAAYDGAQPRLVVKRNTAAGISADTVLATASGGTGSWEQLTGTTASVTDDAALEVYVDCIKGTGGVVYVSDWS